MEKMDYRDAFKKCSRCGGCLAHCPLYLATNREQYVARGKVELMENVALGNLKWNDRLAQIFSTCLLCGSCTENCSNKVDIENLVVAARRELVAAQGLPIIKKNIFQHLLKHNGRLKAVGKLLAFYQKSGIQKLVRTTGLLKVLPGDLDKIERILPTITGESFREKVSFKPLKNDKLKVAYFTGCVTNYVNPQVGYSLLKVLEANNVGVLIPEQYCCGVPAWASGETQVVRFLAEANVKQFMDLDVDYIVTDCATCLSTWLKYPEILNNGNIQKLSAKVIDINRFLIEILDIKLEPADLGIKVTYHDPCHLKRLPLGKEAPRELLNRLSPSFERVEMALADSCCGSAGSFNLTHYNLSQKVVAPKVEAIEKSGAQVVTSSCPSCIMQLNHALRERGSNIEVKHTIELAAQCLQKKN